MNFEELKYKAGPFGFYMALWMYKAFRYIKYDRLTDAAYEKKIFPLAQGYPLDLENPESLNEKIQWMKMHDRRQISIQLADKYAVRGFIENHFGAKYLIPLLLSTEDVNSIRPERLPEEPFIIKLNHDSGHYWIIRDKSFVDWKRLRINLKWWMSFNYYYHSREWQYKNIKPKILVEKLLLNDQGKIPNDYKLHCINGSVAFIYVSVDREGENKRNIYDKHWKPLNFTFAHKSKQRPDLRGAEIEPPPSLEKMIQFAERIAKLYTYVRIDFYDVQGELYFGEVTHHHGSGHDQFRPRKWDYYFGKQLDLNKKTLDNL